MSKMAAIVLFLFLFPVFLSEGGQGYVSARVKCVFDSDCDEALIEGVRSAEKELAAAVFSFTHQKIAKAFVQAAERGVRVRIKYDSEQAEWEGMKEVLRILRDAGISCTAVKMSQDHSAMHNKFTVIDRSSVVTGSFNYSAAGARRNYENLVIIKSKSAAEAYLAVFEGIKSR